MMKITILIPLALLFIPFLGNSQQIDDKNLEVIKNFSSEIYAVNPKELDFKPASLQMNTDHSTIDSLVTSKWPITQLNLKVAPIDYGTPIKSDRPSGFLESSTGILEKINLRGHYRHQVDNYFQINLKAHYNKWQDDQLDLQYESTLDIESDIHYYVTNHWVGTMGIGTSRNEFGLYGSLDNQQTDYQLDSTIFNHFNTYIGIHRMAEQYDDWQSGITINYGTMMKDELEAKSKITELLPYLIWPIGQNYRVTTRGSTILTTNQNSLYHEASISLNKKNILLSGGISHMTTGKEYYVFPTAQVRINIGKSQFNVNLTQNRKFHHRQSITQINPYIEWQETNTLVETVQQLQTALIVNTPNWKFNGELSYSVHKNGTNYIISKENPLLFNTSSVDFKRLRFSQQIDYQINPYWNIELALQYHKYESDDILLYRPAVAINPAVRFSAFNAKLNTRVEAECHSPQKLSLVDADLSQWKKVLNFDLSYRLFDKIYIHGHVDNILDQNFQALKGYNIYGRNISAGLSWRF